MFDPNEHMPEGGRKIEENLTVPGKFLVAFVHVKRARDSEDIYGETSNGSPFVTCKAVVIGGQPPGHKGHIFWPDVFLSPGAFKRLASMLRAMGYVQRFDLRDAPSLKHALLFRPFVAKVETRRHNDRTYASIGMTEEMSDKYEKLAHEWLATEADEWRERAAKMASGSSYNGTDAKPGGRNDFPDDDAPDFGDDDIPF